MSYKDNIEKYSDDDKINILNHVFNELIRNMEPCPPEFLEIFNDHMDELLA